MIETVCIVIPEREEYQHIWNYSLLNFPPNRIILLGDLDKWQHTKVIRRAELIQSLDELPEAPVVLVHRSAGATALDQFSHPEGATYVFGSDDAILDISIEPDHNLYIPTGSDDEMFAGVAYAVTAWDQAHG